MTRRSAGPDYTQLAQRAQTLERELDALFDRFAQGFPTAPSPDSIHAEATALASDSARLAQDLSVSAPNDVGEQTIIIDELSSRADALMSQLPQAVLVLNQDALIASLESARERLSAAHAGLQSLGMPHLSPDEREKTERALAACLSHAERCIRSVQQSIQSSDPGAHPLYPQIERIRSAMSGARAHVLSRQQERIQAAQALLDSQTAQAYAEMRESFCRQMSGRLYVDGSLIQMRSDLTGRLSEWTMDLPHANALSRLMGEPGERVIASLRQPAVVFSARFEVRSANERVHLLIEGGERTVRDGGVSYSAQRFFCSL